MMQLNILEKDIHFWCGSIACLRSFLHDFWKVLDDKEKLNASRFVQEKDKECSIISRGYLRYMLANYLCVNPTDLSFSYNEYGKPYLTREFISTFVNIPIFFNISHSADIVAFALAQNEIGVDVEFMRQDIECLAIAQRYFTSREVQFLLTKPDAQLHQTFFTIWTLKESLLKSLGTGLSCALDKFDLDPTVEEQTIIAEFDKYTAYINKIHSSYASAISIKGTDFTIKTFNNRDSLALFQSSLI